MPENPAPGTLDAKRLYHFRIDSMVQFRLDAREAIKAIDPNLIVTWNQAGDMTQCCLDCDETADVLFRETHRPEDFSSSFQARWFYQFGKPYE